MSEAKNKVDWCLKKAEKELKASTKHRGLIKAKLSIEEAKKHISKAEHNFKAALRNHSFQLFPALLLSQSKEIIF